MFVFMHRSRREAVIEMSYKCFMRVHFPREKVCNFQLMLKGPKG